jgi:hypothetical protein
MDEFKKEDPSPIIDDKLGSEEHHISTPTSLAIAAFVIIAVAGYLYFASGTSTDEIEDPLENSATSSSESLLLPLTENPTVEISEECSIFPKVVALARNDSFKIVNTDTLEHTIEFDNKKYVLGAGEEVDGITSDIGIAPAVLWYRCDNIENAGLFRIYKQN